MEIYFSYIIFVSFVFEYIFFDSAAATVMDKGIKIKEMTSAKSFYELNLWRAFAKKSEIINLTIQVKSLYFP